MDRLVKFSPCLLQFNQHSTVSTHLSFTKISIRQLNTVNNFIGALLLNEKYEDNSEEIRNNRTKLSNNQQYQQRQEITIPTSCFRVSSSVGALFTF